MGNFKSSAKSESQRIEDSIHTKKVYCRGNNEFNQCGEEGYPLKKEKIVVCMASGQAHNLAVLDSGQVISWGSNKYGQLGAKSTNFFEDLIQYQPFTLEVKFSLPVRVKRLACGNWHSACVTQDGQLYAWGLARQGQLGLCPSGPGHSVSDDHLYYYQNPTLVEFFRHIGVSFVACGSNFTLVIGLTGDLFSFGCGKAGVLGTGTYENTYMPMQIPKLQDKNISRVACGWNHCLALSREGVVYEWGSPYSEIDSSIPPKPQPKKVKELLGVQVKEISCGDYHNAVLAKTPNAVFTWGGNGYGQLGYESPENPYLSLTPRPVNIKYDIAAASCGGLFTVVRLKNGTVMGFGSNKYKQLGEFKAEVRKPMVILDGEKNSVAHVVCGHSHISFLTRDEVELGVEKQFEEEIEDKENLEEHKQCTLLKPQPDTDIEFITEPINY